MMLPDSPVTREYCAARSGGLERVQAMAERRMDHHSEKLDDLTGACIRLTAAVDRLGQILEKQDQRLERAENRSITAFLASSGGKFLLRFGGIVLLILLSTAVGINVFQVIKEAMG